MSLFAVYLGGNVPNCNIESHDLVFVVADNIEQTLPKLKQMWHGEKSGCHVDGYLNLDYVDNYEVQISDTQSSNELKLYFINIGYTLEGQLIEQHEFFFVPATNPEEAEAEAKKRIRIDPKKNFTHKDNFLFVDNCLDVDYVIPQYINLIPTQTNRKPELTSTYILL